VFYHNEPTTCAMYPGRDFVELFIAHELEVEKNHNIYELVIINRHETNFMMNCHLERSHN